MSEHPPQDPRHRAPARPRSNAHALVALDETLEHFADGLRTRLGWPIVVGDVGLDDATVWITADAAAPTLRRVHRAHPALTIIVVADVVPGGRHDHARLVATIDAGATACLVEPSPSLLAVHARHLRPRARTAHPLRDRARRLTRRARNLLDAPR